VANLRSATTAVCLLILTESLHAACLLPDMVKNGPIGAAIQLFYRYLKTLGMSPGLEFKGIVFTEEVVLALVALIGVY